MLKARYKPPEWVLLSQVRNGTGYVRDVTRTVDAIAMNTYPSRGLCIHGFEFKARRGDWLSELKHPEKAEDTAFMCDYWWVVTDEGVVADGELPHGWGHIEAKGKRLYTRQEAACSSDPALTREQLLDRPFVAAILRRVVETETDEALIKAARRDAHRKGREEGIEYQKGQQWGDSAKLERLQKSLDEFEAASGVRIGEYDGGHIGKAVEAWKHLTATYGGAYHVDCWLQLCAGGFGQHGEVTA